MSKRKYLININEFKNVEKPEAAYILGLIWADGTLAKESSAVSVTCIKSDLERMKPWFEKVGSWGYYSRIPGGNDGIKRKEQLTIMVNQDDFNSFLLKNDFAAKNNESADKILNLIPQELKKYWWRGYCDGDGCIYVDPIAYSYQLFFTSAIDQKWDFVRDLGKQLDIPFEHIEKKTENGNYSRMRVQDQKSIISFCEFIYDDYKENSMGFFRKYEEYIKLTNWLESKNKNRGSVIFIRDSRYKHKKWKASITYKTDLYPVGFFHTEEAAQTALLEKKKELGLIKT